MNFGKWDHKLFVMFSTYLFEHGLNICEEVGGAHFENLFLCDLFIYTKIYSCIQKNRVHHLSQIKKIYRFFLSFKIGRFLSF
jgi:hypothetical protein